MNNFGAVLGFALGLGFILSAIILGGGNVGLFYNIPSIMIVFGGIFSVLLISYPIVQVFNNFKVARLTLTASPHDNAEIVDNIINLTQTARRDGLLVLEQVANSVEDPFLKKGIYLVVDGVDAEQVREILELDLLLLEKRHQKTQKFWENISDLAPAWGMIGTLVGLINMLAELNDPSAIGPQMSVALVTTFYGVFVANYIATPIVISLRNQTDDEILIKQMIIEGIVSIQVGENPYVTEAKLKTFLTPVPTENAKFQQEN
ncbi:MAG: flagellar motor protein MotP [Epulopiscium sp. Nele67-Bin005]|nr:MAG: flagellar motor protein MotP [Epulopiscium sp. Nele67-Bin005]